MVQREAPEVALSTIYRNLEELERMGVIVHAHLGHGPTTYHLAKDADGHLVCEKCGAMIEVPEDLFRQPLAGGSEQIWIPHQSPPLRRARPLPGLSS